MTHKDNTPFDSRAWPIKALTAAILMGLVASSAHTNPTTINRKPIGDLEIYAPAKSGTASIFMMLDTSGSMDKRSIRNDYGSFSSSCSEQERDSEEIELVIYKRKPKLTAGGTIVKDDDGNIVMVKDFDNIEETIEYTPEGCKKDNDIRFSRLVRLKLALIELLADDVYDKDGNLKDTGELSDDYEIGIGNYSYEGDGSRAVILEPTRALTAEQRVDLIETIIDLEATGGTPTAHALAESGAYMMGTSTKGNSAWWSGFDESEDDTKKNGKYISPLNDQECSGNGIYLLTDGEPNGSTTSRAKTIMNNSLSGSNPALSVDSCIAMSGDSSGRSWGCMASYAALLRNTANNPKSLPIKTATVGFGKEFAGLTGTHSIIINGKPKEVTNCDSGSVNNDTRNLCKLGERKGDNEVKTFGDGGFYYTEESSDIAASIVDFSASLVQAINTAPSGTITIPEDPYRAANQLPYAYLPMLDPDIVSANSIWRGNLKKYSLNEGTLYGKNDNLLFKNITGELNNSTQDLWQTADFVVEGSTANNNIAAGGVYAQLKSPYSGLASLRTVYVEDTLSDQKTPVLRKVAVETDGIPKDFDKLIDDVYTDNDGINKRRLLSFLGFDSVLTNDGQPASIDDVEDLVLTQPTKETKVLGGVVHSAPTVVSYGATLDDNGRITDSREDYVLFGSMDGALHLVDAETGVEAFAIIPKLMMETQPKALVDNSIKAEIGTPYFGVDAPWLVTTDYKYDLDNSKVTVDTDNDKGMFAYGGLRMGGEAFYGIDISDKSNPKIRFSITPNSFNGETSTDFTRLGQIWSKPTAAKVRLTKGSDPNKNTAATDVLIFAGGYDMSYEDPEYVATSAAPAKGNAIYMIDAKDGKLLWSTSAKATDSKGNKNAPTMIHSITGEITVLDRDNDGLMDHLYAADLGGQVFRADFENARIEQFGFAAVDNFSNKGITRVLNASADIDSKYGYRFYNRPVVSFYRNTGGYDNGSLFALVNVISGNRSSPLSTLRDDNKYANRVYGIIDNDITSPDLYKQGFTASVTDLKEASLLNLANELDKTHDADKKQAVKQKMLGEAKSTSKPNGVKPSAKGWYYPLTRFDGYEKVRYNKGVGDMAAINNILYTTVYNPDKLYGTVSSCAARIMGGSERQLYCLPYGICMDETSETGTGGYIPAGQGIHELTLGAYNADNTDLKVLIGTTTIAERIKAANRAGYGADSFKNDSNIKDLYPGTGNPVQAGGDGSATEYLFNERYTLQPKAWYQQNSGQ